jgi:hypothetical protein
MKYMTQMKESELFDEPVLAPIEVTGEVMGEILHALGAPAPEVDAATRRTDFIQDLPQAALNGLNLIQKMVGAVSLSDLFMNFKPYEVSAGLQLASTIDLERVWKAYHEA